MITAIEQNLLNALGELEQAGSSLRTANPKPDLPALFARIDELAKELPRDTDPALLHYLQKKSYEKARLFLQGRDAENQTGNCRHVN
jgi:capsule polysaccharide export protein KpsE/RkpR